MVDVSQEALANLMRTTTISISRSKDPPTEADDGMVQNMETNSTILGGEEEVLGREEDVHDMEVNQTKTTKQDNLPTMAQPTLHKTTVMNLDSQCYQPKPTFYTDQNVSSMTTTTTLLTGPNTSKLSPLCTPLNNSINMHNTNRISTSSGSRKPVQPKSKTWKRRARDSMGEGKELVVVGTKRHGEEQQEDDGKEKKRKGTEGNVERVQTCLKIDISATKAGPQPPQEP